MYGPTKLARSADLMTGMLDRMGKGLAHGTPSQAQARHARNLVFRCAACPDQEGCARLQATALTLDHPPVYCPNAQALTALPDTR
ncbi:DUF6455 family protein [uncultured Tateyamaria sp.]|uniref:DUF6455 family protein n=1 Tax=uncultured Tateyamaria sp. TaxID=455651 RepID=UPI002617B1BF|nr:DUF6455 family protein [uncultured Tateyamaria sp.]